MAEQQLLDRALYKKVKGMDRVAMEQTFKNMYQIGYDAALKEGWKSWSGSSHFAGTRGV